MSPMLVLLVEDLVILVKWSLWKLILNNNALLPSYIRIASVINIRRRNLLQQISLPNYLAWESIWWHRGATLHNLYFRDEWIRLHLIAPWLFCLVVCTAECGSRSLCYSANQPVIPVLLMWEVMLHATLSFSHQCSLCLWLYLSIPLHLYLRDCCFSVIGPLFRLAHRVSLLGMFTWIHASRLLANATPLFF